MYVEGHEETGPILARQADQSIHHMEVLLRLRCCIHCNVFKFNYNRNRFERLHVLKLPCSTKEIKFSAAQPLQHDLQDTDQIRMHRCHTIHLDYAVLIY
jgi:hypothetical protein